MAAKGCKYIDECSIFQNGVLISERTGQAYRDVYCFNPKKIVECKRYLVVKKTNIPIPDYVLPNTSFSPETIIEKIKRELL